MLRLCLVAVPAVGFARAVNMWPWPNGETLWPSLLAKADLGGAVFVETPDDWLTRDIAEQRYRAEWCAERGLSMLTCGPGSIAGAEKPEFLNFQRQLWCDRMFQLEKSRDQLRCLSHFEALEVIYEADWKARRSEALGRLQKRDLRKADLRQANLFEAQMEGVVLSEARLEGANLFRARLEGAELDFARLKGAHLIGARLEGGNISGASLEEAVLWEASLVGAMLYGAQLNGADLRNVKLEGANLTGAGLQGAVLGMTSSASIYPGLGENQGTSVGTFFNNGDTHDDRPYLRERQLFDTYFLYAGLGGTAMQNLDISSSIGLTRDQLEFSFGDASVTLPDDLMPPPAHWPDWELDFETFISEYRRWLANPSTYTPPRPRGR